MIVEQSNLKSLQDNINKPAIISKDEIEQFIGIVILMSCVKLPSTRMYWSKHVGQSEVYETMTCNRFEVIKKNLHFNNNDKFKPRGADGHDKLFKIRTLLDQVRERLLLVPKDEYLSVDEQIIPTKCRHEIKQSNPAKPHKWGYKNLVLSGVSGFSYDFDIFAGDQSNSYPSDAPDLGVSFNVVTRLASTVPKHKNYKICFDNWFNSPKLQVYLFKSGLLSLGTVRLNPVPNSNMPVEKDLKKKGRGSMTEKTAIIDGVKLSLVSWYDNKVVNMLSAYVGSEPKTTKRRYFRREKQFKYVTSPQAVDVYNQHMGGVDLLDSMLGYYRIHLRSRQWYKRIFFHMVDMSLVNACLLWRRIKENDEYMPLFAFKLRHMRNICVRQERF
ncbi:piggyBac transposable element-derived protein 3-like [Eupeodes corollae]|uniref:piggyBac transposable element-derived protein 3-like n=1 Tax=Eupeodes corollae TaxID=290404 RepID=UPI002492F9DB|nr:piggyBac transposable element-derived protein 3-like [Eupeodes corollae]